MSPRDYCCISHVVGYHSGPLRSFCHEAGKVARACRPQCRKALSVCSCTMTACTKMLFGSLPHSSVAVSSRDCVFYAMMFTVRRLQTRSAGSRRHRGRSYGARLMRGGTCNHIKEMPAHGSEDTLMVRQVQVQEFRACGVSFETALCPAHYSCMTLE